LVNIYIAIGAAVIVIAFLLSRSTRSKPPVQRTTSPYTGPASVNFNCAGCGQQFKHTKRTIAAWKKGSRRISCNGCHKNWRDTNPVPRAVNEPFPQPPSKQSAQKVHDESPDRPTYTASQSRSGCLGVIAFFIFIPGLLSVLAI